LSVNNIEVMFFDHEALTKAWEEAVVGFEKRDTEVLH
jgi:hypothetical protein